jgi:hypothetical protein
MGVLNDVWNSTIGIQKKTRSTISRVSVLEYLDICLNFRNIGSPIFKLIDIPGWPVRDLLTLVFE